MVSKNNQYWKQQQDAQRVPHYGLRKLSIGVASVLLSTTLYMGATAHADTVNSQNYEMLNSKVANNSNSSNGDSVVDRGTNSANATNTVSGDSHVDASVAEATAKNEVNTNPQITEINNGSHAQSDAANVKSDVNTPSNEMFSTVATETSPVPMSPSSSSSSQGAVTAPVESEASNEPNSQVQSSSATNTTQAKPVRRPVMRLAVAAATDSNELIVGKDVTISDFSVTAADGKNEFEKSHANIKFTMHADDPSTLAGKHLTIQLDKKVWGAVDYSETERANNPITISYQGQIIGTLDYSSYSYFARIVFNNHVKDYTKINVQSDLVVSSIYQNNLPYKDYLYTPTQAKDGQTYYLTNDVTIGQQKYSSNLPSTIHYYKLESQSVSSVTNETTTSYDQDNSKLYAGTFYKTPDGIYYSQSSIYGGSNLYSRQSGQPGNLRELNLYVGTDMIADHIRSYTATFDIDHTKLSSYSDFKLKPVESYSLTKDYCDDQNLLPNTSDVYVDYSEAYSSTTTADAKVTENSVIFNQLNGQSLATQHVSIKDSWVDSYTTNYISTDGGLYLTPALFKQLQAVAESDQNLTEAMNTVTTTGRDAEIKLVNPIDTGFKVMITTSDGKTKELSLLIDTINYPITTVSTAPKGSILVAAQGKTVKVYHSGDQNIPAVVDQSQLAKTITRTINVHEPGKSVTTIKQVVVLTQSVSVVDGKDVTYNGDWKAQGDSQWASYDVPSVPGYTASQSRVAQQAVTDATQDQTIDITYMANDHQISIEYVDNVTGHVVKTDYLSGKTGQTVSITPHAPDGWELVSGQSVPSEVTVGADGTPTTVIKVQPQERSVAVNFIDDQSFGQPVIQAITLTGHDGDTVDLHLTVPDKYQLADSQQLPTTYTFEKGSGDVTIHLVHQVVQREATVDVQLRVITTVDYGTELGMVVTQNHWKQLDDEIKDSKDYNSDKVFPSVGVVGTLTGHVNYDLVDNKVVSFKDDWTSLNLGGQTYQMPNGTEVVNGMFINSKSSWGKTLKEEFLKYNPDTDPDYVNRTWHGYLSVNKTNEAAPDFTSDNLQVGLAGNEPNALAKAIGDQAATAVKMANKTIDSNWLNGHFDTLAFSKFSEQNGRLQASADLEVMGVYIPYVEKTATRTIKVTTPDGKTTTVEQTATLVKQINVGQDAHPAWTTGEWASYDVPTIPGYTASQAKVDTATVTSDTQNSEVNISYTANDQVIKINYVDSDNNDSVVKSDTLNGKTDQTVKTGITIPEGYTIEEQIPTDYTFKASGNTDITVHLKHVIDTTSEEKTVTRTIKVTDPTGKVTTIPQTAKVTRTVNTDKVTNQKTYGDWTSSSFDSYDVPTIPGYTANKSQVEAVAVDGNTTDQTVNIGYTANKQSVNVNYVDVSDGNKVVHTTTVNGVTDGDSVVSNELPAGYKLVDGQSIPKTIHFNADNNNDINIKVQHAAVTVTPDSPKTPSDKLPDNPDKSYPSGVSENDLNKAITRTIKVTTPNGQSKTTEQTVKLTRTATVDEVTGEVTYGKWSTGQWDSYDVPSVAGYTASQPSVETTPVNENTKDQTVDVNYTPNKQTTTIKYVDGKGQVVHTTTVNGATDQTVKVSSEVPAGWMITNGQVPSEITFGADGHEPIEVTVAHQHVTVVPDNPQNNGTKLPDNPAKTFNGVEANDLNKTITRTIKVTTPDVQTKTVEQAVHLTRTADVDEVTGEVTYSNWTTGEWASYDVPTIPGYTASQNEVPTAKVAGDTKDQTVTVTYTADQQNLIVNFIDDTTGQTLKTVNKDGLTNSNSNYNTKSDIQNYVNSHYRLVSDDTNGQNLVFDNDDSKTQTYNVHLAHNTHDIKDSNTVTETIHYKLDNGQKAFDDYNAQLSFTRTGYNDEVTGQNHWNDWQATKGQTFNTVQSPSKEGYTPDKTSIEAINVNPGDKNIDTTVTYNANAQAAKISYIDDNTGATLKTDNANGKFNQAISFGDVDGAIKGFEDKGYQLKSNSFKDQKYQADNNSNVFEVHLVHGTKNVQRTQKITETINYQMDDSSEAPATNTQSVDFTQDGVQDLVTNNIDWKATEPQQFKAVDIPTVTGYTPDIASVPVTTVNFGDKNINKLVTYKANAQNATINYIDDTTGKTIKTDNANGKFNEPISFDNNVDNQIKAFENQGYVLKSNSFNGQKYQADNNSNVFEVHLVHGTKNVQRTQKITETVNYQMDDGSQAPSTNTQSVNFTQNGVQDLVTNNIDWKATDPQQFKAVDSPALTGYTPDIASVPVTTVNFGDKDINKTVTYKANPQSAKITYIDDNTGKTLKVDDANGKFNQVIDFANMNSDIKDFENQGYVLKSNSFNGQKYQADNAKNTFEVHFTHGTKNVQRQDTITETVKYQYDNGTPAHENNVQTLSFTQDGVQDLVTKNIDWNPTDAQEFKQVDTPAIDGYTPDITSISATKVNFGDSDINKVVTYQANNQTANIYYVDDMTGGSIGKGTANGKFDTVINFGNVNDKINTFKNLGYQLVSNGFNGQTYQSDNSKNVYYVHFTHGIENVQRNKQITETIKYQYENGQQAQPDSVQTVSFNENGSQDLVTKKINWLNDTPQQFKAVSTPTITGYTADIDNIPAVVVNYDNDNINKVVIYKANSQTAKINYIDDTTGKVIKTDTANGKFNQAISFSETPANVVNDLIKRGYKLVSNSFNGQTYQNDNSKNEFTVHLAHNTKNVSKQNTVTRTINYLDNNGKAIQTPTVETVTFTQNGITDLVTGNTTWNTPSSQTFETVVSPTIKGFGKPDVEVVKPQTVNFNDQNVVVNVHYPKATTPTNVNNNTGKKINDNTTTPTVDHNKGKLNPTTFTTTAHQTTPQAHTANIGSQQSITPQSVNKPSEQPTVANNGTKANTLPQTGNSNDNSTAIVGLGLLSGMLGLLGIKGKKKQN